MIELGNNIFVALQENSVQAIGPKGTVSFPFEEPLKDQEVKKAAETLFKKACKGLDWERVLYRLELLATFISEMQIAGIRQVDKPLLEESLENLLKDAQPLYIYDFLERAA